MECGIFRSEVLEGFCLDVEWFLTDPLPKAYETLQAIVARRSTSISLLVTVWPTWRTPGMGMMAAP